MMIVYKKLGYIAFSTGVLAFVDNAEKIDALTDIFVILFWFVGTIISLTADLQDPKVVMEKPIPYVVYSVSCSTALCITVVVINSYSVFPIWSYYPLVLSAAIFGPGIIRKWGKSLPGLADSAVKGYAKKILNVEEEEPKITDDENNI